MNKSQEKLLRICAIGLLFFGLSLSYKSVAESAAQTADKPTAQTVDLTGKDTDKDKPTKPVTYAKLDKAEIDEYNKLVVAVVDANQKMKDARDVFTDKTKNTPTARLIAHDTWWEAALVIDESQDKLKKLAARIEDRTKCMKCVINWEAGELKAQTAPTSPTSPTPTPTTK